MNLHDPNLLKVWGGGQRILAKIFTPEKIHNGTLHWWFETWEEREAFKRHIYSIEKQVGTLGFFHNGRKRMNLQNFREIIA